MASANFDREAYFRQLVDGGLTANMAADLVTKMLETQDQKEDGMPTAASEAVKKIAPQSKSKKGETQTRSAAEVIGDNQDKLTETRRRAWLKSKGIEPTVQHQLDLLYPDTINQSQRFIPNDLARSAIFTAKNRNAPRAMLVRAPLFHLNESIEVLFTGQELRAADDELVWMQLMHYAKSLPLGTPISFSIRQLVDDIGWSKNGTYYDNARECISRLKANEVTFKNSKAYGVSGAMSMISRYATINGDDSKPNEYLLEIDPKIIVLFAGNNFTNHSWETFRKLSPVSRRLADYIESHQHPFPLDLEKFRMLCGCTSKTKTGWRRTVKLACKDMEKNQIAKSCDLNSDDQIYILR